MTADSLDLTQTSRTRILLAGKTLFARQGYEQTSTAAIAREAGSSESQLIRYFGGKAGLLDAIFNLSWAQMNRDIAERAAAFATGHDAIATILSIMMSAFGRDHEIAFLFLFEGRRIRGNDVVLSDGFMKFLHLVQSLVQRGQQDGSFRKDLDHIVMTAALLGAAEGMVRERLLAERSGIVHPYTDETVTSAFAAMLSAFSGGH